MPTRTPWLDAIHLMAAALWLAALVAAGLSAAILFTKMPELKPTLPDYAAYSGEHWKLAAGMVANTIFLVVDFVQLGAALVAILTLGLSLRAANRAIVKKAPPLSGVRIVLLTVACGLLCYQLFILSPRMAENLREYWTAAREGKQAMADAAKAAFDSDHPIASNVLKATAASVLLLLLTSAVGIAQGRDEARA
jgi:hypothetical protein